jgi:acetyl esterase/lipase
MRAAEAEQLMRSEMGVDRTIDGPAGAMRMREFRPPQIDAVMLHIHGGAWMTGAPEMLDLLHEILAKELNLAVVSVDYRLAPEHPHPAGPDDCEAAALWLLDNAADEYGTDRFLIGGESAGAHLSMVTLLRMRDRHDAAARFRGANLVFGAYDLTGGFPSNRGVGIEPGSDLLDPQFTPWVYESFLPGMSEEERRAPDISPMHADLTGLPPALLTVGTGDHLLDDTLLFAARYEIAGNETTTLVYPDAPHGCIALPAVGEHWFPRLTSFVRTCIEG